jgi:hypothetical protein
VAAAKPARIKDARQLRPAKATAGAAGDAAANTNAGEAAGVSERDVEQASPPDDAADRVPLAQLEREAKASKRKGKPRAEKAEKPPGPARAPKAKPAKETKDKPMSALDAAAEVLKAAGGPMRCKEMVAAMRDKGLWQSDAPTPAATLSSALLREITAKGVKARFRKADRGLFELRT